MSCDDPIDRLDAGPRVGAVCALGAFRAGAALARDGAALARDGAALAREGAAFARDGAALARDGAAFALDGAAFARAGAAFARDDAAFARDVVARDEVALARAGAAFARAGVAFARAEVAFPRGGVAFARDAVAMARGGQPDWSNAAHHDDPAAALQREGRELIDALSADSGTFPEGMAAAELAVHTYDVATSLGRSTADLDPEIAETGLAFMSASMTDDMRGNAFGPQQPAPDDATAYERIAAFAGRPV